MQTIRLRWVILFFLLLSTCVYAPVLFGYRSFFATDITTQNHGYRAWAANTLKQGELPAWSPLIFTGFPVIAESQAGVFYPLFALFLILPVDLAYNIFVVVHYALGAIFLFLFLRENKISDRASILVSTGFYFSSLLINYHVYPNHLSALVWLPAISASASYFRTRPAKGFLVASALFCVQIFAGHIQFVWLTILFGVLLEGLVWESDLIAKLRHVGIFWVAAPLFGLLLAAAQVLPTFELYLNSQRSTHDFLYATTPSFQLRFLAQAFLPSSFGALHNLTYSISGPQTIEEMMNLFVGIPILFFAILALLFDKTPKRFVLLGIAVLGLALSLGSNQPFYNFIWKLPVFSFFRYPNRYIVLSVFAFLFLAGYGADAVLKGEITRSRTKIAFLILFSGVVLSWFLSTPLFREGVPAVKIQLLNQVRIQDLVCVLITIFAAFLVLEKWPHFAPLLALLLVSGIFLGYPLPPTMKRSELLTRPQAAEFLESKKSGRFDSYYDTYIEDTIYNQSVSSVEKYKKMRQLLCGDLNMIWGIPSTRGIYHPLIPANYYKEAGIGASWLLNEPAIRLLGLQYYLADRPLPEPLSHFALKPIKKLGDVQIYQYSEYLPRVWISGRPVPSDPKREEAANVLFSSNRKVMIHCELMESGVLVLRDLYYPGWKVSVDGNPSKIEQADHLFRGVFLNRGVHTVVFEYPALIVKTGILISSVSFLILVLLYRKTRAVSQG